jgi:hypothetical protein
MKFSHISCYVFLLMPKYIIWNNHIPCPFHNVKVSYPHKIKSKFMICAAFHIFGEQLGKKNIPGRTATNIP